MSEIWDSNSSIEEKHSISYTPQLSQLRTTGFNIRGIYDIIKKFQNNEKIEEYDYKKLCWFIDSEYAEKYDELSNYVKSLFGDSLKNEYFRLKLENNKDKILNYEYDLICNYFFKNELEEKNIDAFKNYLYKAMQKIPELFVDDMLSKEYKEKISQVLTSEDIKERDLKASKFSDESSELEITEIIYQKKLLNDIFKNEVLKNIPQDYNDLEKSIYIYIKLCQLLSYDPKYYVNKEKFKQEHMEYQNISKIGQEKNDVVCYEFVTIYSEMLKDMGISVASTTGLEMDIDEESNIVYPNFADKHSNLKYSVNDILIFADSTISVLGGDMINAKANNRLNGLKCLSVEENKKKEFKDALEKVYNNLKIENSIFKKYGKDVKEKTLVEKLKILFDDINGVDFNATDFISYITTLKHELFTEYELDWNLKINFVGKNDSNEQYPVAIFSVNTNDIKNVQADTIQYLYDAKKHELIKYDNQELKQLFDSELFKLEETKAIPGISNNKLR